jgi:hypothetical protein
VWFLTSKEETGFSTTHHTVKLQKQDRVVLLAWYRNKSLRMLPYCMHRDKSNPIECSKFGRFGNCEIWPGNIRFRHLSFGVMWDFFWKIWQMPFQNAPISIYLCQSKSPSGMVRKGTSHGLRESGYLGGQTSNPVSPNYIVGYFMGLSPKGNATRSWGRI